MRRFLFPATIFTAVCTAFLAVPAAALPAAASAGNAGPPGRALAGGGGRTLSVSSQLGLRRYAVAGDRAYDLGTENGRYPAMGFHTRGEMGGIWTPPIKLLDGIWFGINGRWIGPATKFTSGFGYARMALPATGGVRLTRTDFAPDGRRAVEIGLTLSAAAQPAHLNLNVDAHSELMSAYPWGFTTPDQTTFNLPDRASFNGHQLVFTETGTPPVPMPHRTTGPRWSARPASPRGRGRRCRIPRPAGSAGHLPGRVPAGQIPVRRHGLRPGRGRGADLPGHRSGQREQDDLVHGGRLRPGPRRRTGAVPGGQRQPRR